MIPKTMLPNIIPAVGRGLPTCSRVTSGSVGAGVNVGSPDRTVGTGVEDGSIDVGVGVADGPGVGEGPAVGVGVTEGSGVGVADGPAGI